MLFFLSIAAASGYVIDEYIDEAIGHMDRDADGRAAMTKVILRPRASYSGERIPDREIIETMHHRAHEMCFIANSVKTDVSTEILA